MFQEQRKTFMQLIAIGAPYLGVVFSIHVAQTKRSTSKHCSLWVIQWGNVLVM